MWAGLFLFFGFVFGFCSIFFFVFCSIFLFSFLLFSKYQELAENVICYCNKHCRNEDLNEPVVKLVLRIDLRYNEMEFCQELDKEAFERNDVYEEPHDHYVENPG